MITMSASGVVSMAFASTGFVLLCTMPSKVFAPSRDNLVKMLKDDLAHFAPQARRTVVFELLVDIEASGCSQYLHSASPFTACTCIGSLPSFEKK